VLFYIDSETCPDCGGSLRIIACIEYPPMIAKILWHVQQRAALDGPIGAGAARVASAVRKILPILVGLP
jgi:hypothetical protein